MAAMHFLLGLMMEQWIAWHYSLGFWLPYDEILAVSLPH